MESMTAGQVDASSDTALVTVLVPAFNYGHYIEEAIRSVWNQTYRSIELVVVDDGSTDNTLEVLRSLSPESPFPMRIVEGRHEGIAAALNLGLLQSRGEWISILHADDFYRHDKVELQIATAVMGVTLVHSDYAVVDSLGSEVVGVDSRLDLPPAKGGALRDILLHHRDVRSPTMMYRREALMEYGGYDESLPVEDWQSILRLSRAGMIAHVAEPLVYRRVHDTNWSKTVHRSGSEFDLREIGFPIICEVLPSDLDFERVCALHLSNVLINTLAQGNYVKSRNVLATGWREFPSARLHLLPAIARGLASRMWARLRPILPPSYATRITKVIRRAR